MKDTCPSNISHNITDSVHKVDKIRNLFSEIICVLVGFLVVVSVIFLFSFFRGEGGVFWLVGWGGGGGVGVCFFFFFFGWLVGLLISLFICCS